ncbi:E3 ubiquitin-protein ligase NEURL3 [Trichomycterus rosablanca]|uniref:E3 ubiquitin-protein ligase NEURL3 n=1 Tax=Trichomycterus rosablanca TaxID=2290929 RepID=UPI002F35336C
MEMKSKDSRCSCSCRKGCLGPLAFHPKVKGQHVTLSEGGRRATRDQSSFRHGLVFSSRPIKLGEKVHLRVERSMTAWHGALRIGFTDVMPGSRPVPSLAIPELTSSQGYWATPIPEWYSSPRTELTFWVTNSGYLHVETDNGYKHSLRMAQTKPSKPVWTMIDVYGQTSAVLLLGSEKKGIIGTRHSCPAPKINPTDKHCGYDEIPTEIQEKMKRRNTLEERIVNIFFTHSNADEENCVVCFSEPSTVILKCGHCCLCSQCAPRVVKEFGTCPLCRQYIRPL